MVGDLILGCNTGRYDVNSCVISVVTTPIMAFFIGTAPGGCGGHRLGTLGQGENTTVPDSEKT